jgi:hypothetical protein
MSRQKNTQSQPLQVEVLKSTRKKVITQSSTSSYKKSHVRKKAVTTSDKVTVNSIFAQTSFKFDETSAKRFIEINETDLQLVNALIEITKAISGKSMYFYQYAIVFRTFYSLIIDEPIPITILISRQAGKTEAFVFAITTILIVFPALAKHSPKFSKFKYGAYVGLFAPQKEQVSTGYTRVVNMLNSNSAQAVMSDEEIDTSLTSYVKATLSNGSLLFGQSTGKNSKIEGKSYHLCVVDEAQDVDDYIIEKSISPMLVAVGGVMMKIGTTGTTKNHFYLDILSNKKLNAKCRDSRLFFHFEFNYIEVINYRRKTYEQDGDKTHLLYEKFVLAERDRMIERGKLDIFKLNYELVWNLEDGHLISEMLLEKMLNTKRGFVSAIPNTNVVESVVVAGLDIGKTVAKSVLTVANLITTTKTDIDGLPIKVLQVIAWYQFDEDYEKQHYAISQKLAEHKVQLLCPDYTGVGKAVVDRLQYAVQSYCVIVPITFNTQVISDMYFNLLSFLNNLRCDFPANRAVQKHTTFKMFKHQMSIVKKVITSGYLSIDKSNRKILLDYVDSLALCANTSTIDINSNEEAPPEFTIESNIFYS